MTVRMNRSAAAAIALLAMALLPACTAPRAETPPAAPPVTVQVATTSAALARAPGCEDRFVPHALGVMDGARMREIRTYASNGAGLAAGDLDGDGDLDLVLASTDRESTLLWNQGGLAFAAEPLADPFTRAAAIVDVGGDGLLDVVFTHRGAASLSYWRNRGPQAPRFAHEDLPGVTHHAYTMAWGDLNGDGTLDLVAGAYEAELKSHGLSAQEIAQRGGVALYEQRGARFAPRPLAARAQTLAIALVDLDGDGLRDIWAANDFALPDGHWLRRGDAWEPAQPFAQTSHSTMSIDWGDIANDGRLALFSTDMNPGDIAPAVLAAWLPVIGKLEEKHGPADPQIMANTLQLPDGAGRWHNEAARRGVDATGWSWSGRFGDLDNDGFLDLYVVNGMIAQNLFGHLPGAELVEENRAFHNRGDGSFRPAPEWGLAATESGRGMLMADMDADGDLDVVVNNLRGPAMLFENRLCGGDGLEVDLHWRGSPNTRAVGAVLELDTSMGTLRRDVRAMSGYLAGDPPRVHFGFPPGTELRRLVIRYPDGAVAQVEGLAPQTLIEVIR
ncbi:MAG TPA: CRTAC1 family protein [Roseiflexaceae bacterium]|nr:CRTAC1 family protein [Roseiflexaceae bacterium]